MDYLARNAERIRDPRRVSPGARSLLVVGLAHSRAAVELPGGARIARYAAGRDYHNVVTKKLRRLRERLAAEGLVAPLEPARAVVDAGPLLERSHAAEAALGFLSKAANLLHPRFGPWFFLGELLLEKDLDPTPSPPAGSCGTCTACLDACPTGAIVEPGSVDARRCISYHTIEHRGAIPREARAGIGRWAFGCDVCSEVCPWGSRAPDLSERFGTHRAVSGGELVRWVELRDPADWSRELEGSALRRAGREGLARNAAIVLGNAPADGAEGALLRALSFDPSAVVREAAGWALLRGYGDAAGLRARVADAARSEPDPGARAELERSLDEAV
jgi:epoxyqueuosine reductase